MQNLEKEKGTKEKKQLEGNRAKETGKREQGKENMNSKYKFY